VTTGGVESLGCRTIRRYYLILGGLGVVTIPPRPRPDPALGVTVGHGNRAWAGRGRRRTNRTLESFILGFCCLDGGACPCACGFYVDQPVTHRREEIRLPSNAYCDLWPSLCLVSGAERLMWPFKSTSNLGVVNHLGDLCRDILAGS